MIEIRAPEPRDEAAWRQLWTDYLRFYESSVPEEVYRTTWSRLLADGDRYRPRGLLAFSGERLVGLVHFLLHSHAWRVEDVTYLQDLYADPDMRGMGVGRRLIEAVYAEADALDAPNVYWLTESDNHTGRRLYDRIGTLTKFIRYQRPPRA
ncbi:GNAT family N-acetyltransferase [Pacificimonas sp. WHA3]|uniref:GNAT family N-acetyltransferase n=1 Tax=Pacificimonas pallii TaxID=2827236 RepID=A0ABS6SGY8_9SPHN|nr:GNAT family N-acetyltransferase [Pacificimonas pallii]MBV7257689.1 GNAT family N-acetyltransferase [Pacificimonas pallii]